MSISECPGCGVVSAGVVGPTHPYMLSSPACWEMYGEVLARSYEAPRLRRVHQLLVDSYAVQHPGVETRQAVQSVCLHLMTLCLFIERGADPADGPLLHKQMLERPAFRWLDPPLDRGDVTVAQVRAASDTAGHIAAAEAWARSAWEAWARHHETIRGWLDLMTSSTRSETQ
jgi:hypothetical protein